MLFMIFCRFFCECDFTCNCSLSQMYKIILLVTDTVRVFYPLLHSSVVSM